MRRRLIGWLVVFALGCGGPPAAAPEPSAEPGQHGHGQGGEHAAGHEKGHGHVVGHRFDDPERWAKRWDTPERDAWQRPDQVVARLGLAADADVADIGAGTGYFSLRLARAAPQGRTWAIDVEPNMVAWIGRRAAEEQVPNVVGVLGAFDNPEIPEPVDLVFICNTYHHFRDRAGYFERLKASLQAGGRVAIVDFKLDAPEGPPKAMRLTPEQIIEEMTQAGYQVQLDERALLERQYLLVFGLPK